MTTITTDTIRLLPVDDRAGFLRELAEHVANEAGFNERPFTRVVKGLVPATASRACDEPLVWFEELVDAIRESQAFEAGPRSYADVHDLPTDERSLDRLSDQLQSRVDAAVQELLSAAPSTQAASA